MAGLRRSPRDPTETVDTDRDGIGNNTDPDDDNDGLSDAEEQLTGTDPLNSDTDGEGVGDATDAFPLDSSEWVDTDGDGVGDNADVFPNDSTEWADTDEDGVGDNADPFIGAQGVPSSSEWSRALIVLIVLASALFFLGPHSRWAARRALP